MCFTHTSALKIGDKTTSDAIQISHWVMLLEFEDALFYLDTVHPYVALECVALG